jgi:hypothetical protein
MSTRGEQKSVAPKAFVSRPRFDDYRVPSTPERSDRILDSDSTSLFRARPLKDFRQKAF